jgi:uncharacterized protein YxjI
MKYLMRQKLLCLGKDFTVQNENGDGVFYIDGNAFNLVKKASFQDMKGRELALIREVATWPISSYEIYRDGNLFAVASKDVFTFRLVNTVMKVDVPGPDDLEVLGNILDHDYTFHRRDREIAKVSMKWFTVKDTYGVDVAHGEDDVLILACAVVIDMQLAR